MNAVKTWTVTADMENNAEIWWSACRSQFPTMANNWSLGLLRSTTLSLPR